MRGGGEQIHTFWGVRDQIIRFWGGLLKMFSDLGGTARAKHFVVVFFPAKYEVGGIKVFVFYVGRKTPFLGCTVRKGGQKLT